MCYMPPLKTKTIKSIASMIEEMGSINIFRDPDGPWMVSRRHRDSYLSVAYEPTAASAIRKLYKKWKEEKKEEGKEENE